MSGAESGDVRASGHQALARKTAQMMGVALSLLFVSFLVAQRTETVLSPSVGRSHASFEAGSIELVDDDADAPMFAARTWAPGMRERRCLAVDYRGTHSPVDVTMTVKAAGSLAELLRITVEQGTGGGFEACDGFEPSQVLFEGTLRELADQSNGRQLLLYVATVQDSKRTLRISAELPEGLTTGAGATASADFIWSASPQ